MPLTIQPGRVIDRVRLSPELCRVWMKYLSPPLADATSAEGELSLTLSRGNVSLTNFQQCDVAGVVSIHSAQIGPGPQAEPYLLLADEIKAIIEKRVLSSRRDRPRNPWLTLDEQELEFQMIDGRIHHRRLVMHVDDVAIYTYGSVGLDQTIDLMVEIPIQDDWVKDDRLLSALKGQIVKIPIRGTIANQQIDRAELRKLTSQLIGGAADRVIEDQIRKGLDRLFPPRQN